MKNQLQAEQQMPLAYREILRKITPADIVGVAKTLDNGVSIESYKHIRTGGRPFSKDRAKFEAEKALTVALLDLIRKQAKSAIADAGKLKTVA